MAGQAPPPTAASKLSAYLSKMSPIPSFPLYTGPHKVGTVDVEIPVSELEEPCQMPHGAEEIHTVLFRIFYPATPDATGKRITWLPNPQRQHLSGYMQFLNLGPRTSNIVSFLPRHWYYASIPVIKNAALLEPPADCHGGRWPTMVFSHGLGGTRNAYSHIAGSLASHGVVVVCPEHRDGSAIATMVRNPTAVRGNSFFAQNPRAAAVAYQRIPHTTEPATWASRDAQLRIRTWEIGLMLEALLAIDGDSGKSLTNLNTSTTPQSLSQFAHKLHIREPGSIIWAGHSFGGATIVQLLKSTYYADRPELKSLREPIFVPSHTAQIRGQVTEQSATILLDMWCFPLVSPKQAALFRLPLPCYADVPTAPGGAALLAIESSAFFEWTEHLHTKGLVLSPDPTSREVSASSFDRPASGVRQPEPNFFYVRDSAHLNQSDFGILFPWLTGKIFNAREPERALRLNVRAILQILRSNGYRVARTCAGDLVDSCPADDDDGDKADRDAATAVDGLDDDPAILDRNTAASGRIDAWCWVDIIGLGGKSSLAERRGRAGDDSNDDVVDTDSRDAENEDGELDMQGELEPHFAQKPSLANAAAAASG